MVSKNIIKTEEKNKDVLNINLTEMPLVKDLRGSLTFGEFSKTVPFHVKRYFIVYDVPSLSFAWEGP